MEKSVSRLNKRGQDLSIGTLILIVLGIVVLVLLILGFSLGWENLWEKINIFGGSNSLGDVAASCNIAATQQNKYSYCQDFKRLTINGEKEYVSCEDSRLQPSIDTKLQCEKPERYNNWAEWFCTEGLTDDDREDNVKVNGVVCPEPTKTCSELRGELVTIDEDETREDATCQDDAGEYPKNDENEELRKKIVSGYKESDEEDKICCVLE